MNVETSLGRIRTQLSGMERMVRILRAEVESHIGDYAPEALETLSEVPSGLGTLFREGVPMAPLAVQPYEHFARGVWMGFDPELGDTGATVAMKALPARRSEAMGRGIARMAVNPVFPLAEKPRWVTLETALDLEALKAARGLRIDTICFFEVAPDNSAQIPRTLALTLRLHRKGGGSSDHLNYRVPVTSMPFEHSARIRAASWDEIGLADVTEAVMILELPLAGAYTLKLDHFAVLATDRDG